MVIGFVEDKELNNIIPLFSSNNKFQYYITQSNNQRAIDYKKLSALFTQHQINHKSLPTITDCLKDIKPKLQANDLVFIGGSTFMVANFLEDDIHS